MKRTKIALALDGMKPYNAFQLTSQFGSFIDALKLHDMLDAHGPLIIADLAKTSTAVPWVDYKLHDTKDTVALRVKALVGNGAKIITVHASGGIEMMQHAVKATFNEAGVAQAEIWAITVLTSLDDQEIQRVYGKDRTREQIVHEFALMAKEAGVRTVVCSAMEVGVLSQSEKLEGMQFTVPGTRSVGVDLGQQKRSGTPAQAVIDGADWIVAGSQVTKADDPLAAFKALIAETRAAIRNNN